MKIEVLSVKGKGFFEDSNKVVKKHRPENTKKLQTRLDNLDAAQSMEDMRNLPDHREVLKNDRAGQFSARLHGGLRLIVKPQKQPPPTKRESGLDWRAIDSIHILEMVDHHD